MARPIPDDELVTLKEACEIVFRNKVKPATLKAAAGRGQLPLSKIGRTYFTTIRDVRALHHQCRVEQKARGSISIGAETSGSSEMARISSARDALRLSMSTLKSSSRGTSPASTAPRLVRSR